jgi:hypothetical protein
MKTWIKSIVAVLVAAVLAITMPLWNAVIARNMGQPDGDGPFLQGILFGFLIFPPLTLTLFFALTITRGRASKIGLSASATLLFLILAVDILKLHYDSLPHEVPTYHIDLLQAAQEMRQIQDRSPSLQFAYEPNATELVVRIRKSRNEQGIVEIKADGVLHCTIVPEGREPRYNHSTVISSPRLMRASVAEMIDAL